MATDRRDDVTAVPFNLRADAYAGTADAYVRFRVPYPPALLERVRRRARLSGAGRLLDLGCGPGRVANAVDLRHSPMRASYITGCIHKQLNQDQ